MKATKKPARKAIAKTETKQFTKRQLTARVASAKALGPRQKVAVTAFIEGLR